MGRHYYNEMRADFKHADQIVYQRRPEDTLLEFGLDVLVRVMFSPVREMCCIAQSGKTMTDLNTKTFRVTESTDTWIGFYVDTEDGSDGIQAIRAGKLDLLTAMRQTDYLYVLEMVPVQDHGKYLSAPADAECIAVIHSRIKNMHCNKHLKQEWFPGADLRVGDL